MTKINKQIRNHKIMKRWDKMNKSSNIPRGHERTHEIGKKKRNQRSRQKEKVLHG